RIPVSSLCIQKFEQRSCSVLVCKRNRVPNVLGFLQVLLFVRAQLLDGTFQSRVRGIDISERATLSCISEPLISSNVELCTCLFSLVLIKDPEGKTDAETDIGVVRGRLPRDGATENRIG